MKLIIIYLLIFIFAFIGFCTGNTAKNDENVLFDEKANQKYGITALFYGENLRYGDDNEFSLKIIRSVVFRSNKTGEEVKYLPTGQLPAGNFYFTEVWSPDEEYAALPMGTYQGIAIFKAKNLLQNIKENRYFDTIKTKSVNSGFYGHEFEKWEDNSTFSFRAGLDGDMYAFKYQIEKSELYCYRVKCDEQDIGFNNRGKIKAIQKGEIEPTEIH